MTPFLLLAAGDSSGLGTVVAAVILAFLPAGFMAPLLYRVFAKSATKGYSKRAVQSVGVFLAAFSVGLGTLIMAIFSRFTGSEIRVYAVLTIISGAFTWSAAIIGLMLSIQGLRETDRKRKQRRRRGHNFAVGGCSSNSILLALLLGAGAFYAVKLIGERDYAEAGPSLEAAAIFSEATRIAVDALEKNPGGVTTAPMTTSGLNAGNGDRDDAGSALVKFAGTASENVGRRVWFGRLFGSESAESAGDPGPEVVAFSQFNFRLRRPGDGWIRLDPARVEPSSAAAYDLPARALRFLAIAERPGVESGSNSGALAEKAKAHLRATALTFDFSEPEKKSYGGVEGVHIAGSAVKDGELCAAQIWAAVHNGYWYQLLMVGSGMKPDAYLNEAERVFGLFELVDPAETAHAVQLAKGAGDARKRDAGFEVPLSGTSWTTWPDFAQNYEHAEYGARLDAQTAFVLVEARLDGDFKDLQAAASSLLSMVDQSYVRAAARGATKTSQSGLQGETYSWTVGVGIASKTYSARVFVGRRQAFLLLGWCDATGSPRYEALEKALGAVKFVNVPNVQADQLPAGARVQTAQFYDGVGRYYLDRQQLPEAESAFAICVKYAPERPQFLVELVETRLRRQRNPEALSALDGAKSVVERNSVLRVLRARTLAELGKREDAAREYAAVFQDGYLNDADLRGYVDLLESLGRVDDALAAVGAYRTRRNTPDLLALEARLLSRRGDSIAAARMLERHLSSSPGDAEPTFVLADIYRRSLRPTDALQTVERLIGAGGGTAAAYYWKGLAEYDLRHLRPAKEAFAQAARLDPTNVAAKQMLDHIGGMLGEFENLRITSPINPVPLPKAVVDAVPTSPMPDGFAQAPAYYLDRVTAYSFKPGVDYRRTEYHKIRILTSEGVDELNLLTVRFDPRSEEAYVNRLDVYDDSGRPVAAGDVATFYVVDDTGVGQATRDKLLQIPVPGLRPGYRVELTATIRSFVGRTEFPYVQQLFGLPYPVRRQAISISADSNLMNWSGTLADGVRRDADGVWWQAVDIPAYRREPFAPDAAETKPSLFVADKRNTWERASLEYLEEMNERRTVPEVVEKTAHDMTAGLEGTEAKLLALSAFVQREIAYQPVPFSNRSRVPQPPDRTLANRFGDSKDIAFLLAQMLASVEVDTRPALVNLTQPVQPKLATLDQFDHMVVFIPQGDGGRVIDATDKEADARLPVPLRLAGRDALVIDDKEPRIVRLNRVPLDAYRATIERRVTFNDQGSAKLRETLTFHDYYAAAMRGRLHDVDRDLRLSYWQTLLRESGTRANVSTWRVDRLDDLTQPLVVTVEYDIDRVLTSVEGEWVGAIPAPFETTLLPAEVVETRREPVDFPYALRVTSQIDVEVPPGTSVPDAATVGGKVDGDLISAALTAQAEQGALKLTFDLTRPSGRYAPARYDDYRQATRRVRIIAAPTVKFGSPTK